MMTEPTLDFIRECVCRHYQITPEAFFSVRRERRVARPRQVAFWLARTLTSHSFPQIGRAYRRDHTTIQHGCAAINDALEVDTQFARELDVLIAKIENGALIKGARSVPHVGESFILVNVAHLAGFLGTVATGMVAPEKALEILCSGARRPGQ